MPSIEPQVFATAVTGGIALLSFLGQSFSSRRVDARARRTIADASSLITFYREWHSVATELHKHGDSIEANEALRKLSVVEQDVTKIWERSRREADGNGLRWLKLPLTPVTTGGRLLHGCYYLSLLAIVWIILVMAVGLSDPNETTEGRLAGIMGTITIVLIFSGFAWIFRRLANRIHARARAEAAQDITI